MKHDELESRIHKAFSVVTPDILGSLLSEYDTQKETIIMMPEKKNNRSQFRRILATAALSILVIAGAGSYVLYGANYAVDSIVSLNINPSIAINVNRRDQALDVNVLNEDGKIVISDIAFAGNDLDVTVNALIGSMFRNGYLTDLSNSILLDRDDDGDAPYCYDVEFATGCREYEYEINATTGAIVDYDTEAHHHNNYCN